MPIPADIGGLPPRGLDSLTDADLGENLGMLVTWCGNMVPRWASRDEFERLVSIRFSVQPCIIRDAMRAVELGNTERGVRLMRNSDDYLWNSRRTIRDDRLGLHRLYAIVGERKRVKIGITSDLNNRMKDLQRGCPLELELFASRPGDFFTEQYLHLMLREYQIRGEWYWLVPKVASVICGYMDVVSIPDFRGNTDQVGRA